MHDKLEGTSDQVGRVRKHQNESISCSGQLKISTASTTLRLLFALVLPVLNRKLILQAIITSLDLKYSTHGKVVFHYGSQVMRGAKLVTRCSAIASVFQLAGDSRLKSFFEREAIAALEREQGLGFVGGEVGRRHVELCGGLLKETRGPACSSYMQQGRERNPSGG